ncbi:DUF4124 domain-containing protein [Jeongeupia naejangsanensis]|uniref:DUF4124 domain-containing protein n=1 Tax=Jeongeupia naejangsanensis TaxID=613195 RepID=A0ABS2BL83_9NEIS|nr:DUF4124 domain-containing protein [Jeongeupia naejangsanensis]MBM3116384.1 DUF4124 domain-containing protein [Jeongeupia naejangsanensis]
MRGVVLGLMLVALSAQAAPLYRWIDESGNVQFSDKPPANAPKSGVSELDKRGMVKRAPEKAMSDDERARQQMEAQQRKDAQRRDKALLQSFSKPEEIDLLRDRQVEALQGGLQTNKLRRQNVEQRLARQQQQQQRLLKAKKVVPADLDTDIAISQKELADLDTDSKAKLADIDAVKRRADADKKRLAELRGPN